MSPSRAAEFVPYMIDWRPEENISDKIAYTLGHSVGLVWQQSEFANEVSLMTLQYKGNARVPGALGNYPASNGGRLPGPLGNPLWDKKSVPSGQDEAAKAVVKTTMPLPMKDHDSKDVHVVDLPLFNSRNRAALEEVKQAPAIPNCPVAAILAAFAFTPDGQNVVFGMVSETKGKVLTDLSAIPQDTFSNPPGKTITSSRYFSVKLAGGTIGGIKLEAGPAVVSDVLYTDDHDEGWSPLYLQDPSGRTIWASIIEKAVALKLQGYQTFMDVDLKANDYWQILTGVRPGGIEIKNDTPLTDITDAAKAATRIPTIGASKPDSPDVRFVSEFHGFAIMGLQGSKIKIYDPAKAKTIFLSPEDFRHDFQAILFRR